MTLQQYAQLNPEEYANKAVEANESGKTLAIKGKKLILIDRSLDELKIAKKAEINSNKIQEEYSDITYLGSKFQADKDSQFRLNSAILMVQTLNLKSYDWFTVSNKKKALSAAELKKLGLMLSHRTSKLVDKARALKDAIEAAKTNEEVEAVTWTIS